MLDSTDPARPIPDGPDAACDAAVEPPHEDSMDQHVDRTVVSADGTVIAVSDAGTGPALVVVAGAFDHHGTPFLSGLAAALRDRYRVVTYDRRGRGASGDTEPWSIDREVEDLAAVVASIGGPVSALGVCVGAGVVLHGLAGGVPLEAAVLWEPPYRATVDPHADDVVFADVLDEHVAVGRRAQAVRAFLAQVLGVAMGQITALRLKGALWRSLVVDAHVLSRDVRVLNGLAIPERVAAAVGDPVLVAAGGDGPDWVRRAARAVVEAVPGSQYAEVPGQGHVPEPEAIGHVLDRFTARTTARS
ncbi:pimeloyl-ACP methyl ester carboxylesterase [Curtobacterium pusillum]|uniref:Pimeloyl-ACP methyl ester carboxylesterase n=1 Tax=Curtobacterium pusillum TaxID=69373 RepID=A0AAW3T3E3_9MICO|nr:alpha/beta hydrolase [Curtobacterium pusillum]MBA8989164.1 pimeloyl-ACP methyl ester carboxylesterase [Curtobacterium pusillum]